MAFRAGQALTAEDFNQIGVPAVQRVAHRELTSAQQNFSITGIPDTGTHLEILVNANIDDTTMRNVYFRLNGDTADNYAWWRFTADGNSVPSPTNNLNTGIAAYGRVGGGRRSVITVRIFNYTSNLRKSYSSEGSGINNITGPNQVENFRFGGDWDSLDVISSIEFTVFGTNSYTAGTSATVYTLL